MPTGTLEFNLSVKLNIDGNDYNVDHNYLLGLVQLADQRTVLVSDASEITILNVAAAAGAGQLTALDFLCIINTDTLNFCRLRISKNSGQTFDVKLLPGQVFLLHNRKLSANTGAGAFSAFVDLDAVKAQFDTAPGTLKILACQK